MEINSKELEKPEVPTIQSSTDAISETVTGNENEEDIDGMTKKVRKRKKALYSAIRDLMEFYFSDANISKDRFMQNAIKDGPVPLDIFMNFNKLRSICDDVKEVAKALKYSTILKLSNDETKVSRLNPFCQKSQEETDRCTIYIENLPPNATIEWVTRIFSKNYGSVAYVSLPKFKDGMRIKGFAFVEFNAPESAAKAIEAYSRSGSSYLASLSEDPGQLCSIQAFNAENLEEMKNKTETAESENVNIKVSAEGKDDDAPQSKRRKLEKDDQTETNKVEEPEPKTEATQTIGDEAVKNQEPDENNQNKPSTEKMKKQRRNKDEEALILSIQVMSKREWKKLRNKYLDMQRKCYRQVRNQSNPRWQQKQQQQQHQRSEPSNYPHSNPESSASASEEKTINVAPADFQAGVIVKIVLDEPISDAKRFKEQVRSQDGVTYVEAEDFKQESFVRCRDADAAKTLVGKKIWTRSDILQGDEEKDYWRKIEESRLMKRDKNSAKGQNKSGAKKARQKKLAVDRVIDADQPNYPTRAAQHKNLHIRFDDD